MSIQSRMRKVQVYNPKKGYDDFGRPLNHENVFEETPCAEVLMSITTRSDLVSSNTNMSSDEIRYSQMTHVGLTPCKTLCKGQLIKDDALSYLIDLLPNPQGRLNQIHLKVVTDDE